MGALMLLLSGCAGYGTYGDDYGSPYYDDYYYDYPGHGGRGHHGEGFEHRGGERSDHGGGYEHGGGGHGEGHRD
jgi:hypothetical protein